MDRPTDRQTDGQTRRTVRLIRRQANKPIVKFCMFNVQNAVKSIICRPTYVDRWFVLL